MKFDKRCLIIGICFLIGTLLCVVSMLQGHKDSYFITGAVVFTIAGIGFIRKSING